MLPVERQVRKVSNDVAQLARVDLLDNELVEGAGEILGQAQRLGGIDARQMPLDEPGQGQQPLDRVDRGRDRLAQRLERAADPGVELLIADRHQPVQQKAPFGAADERIGDGTRRAVVRNQDKPACQAGFVPAMLRDQPGGERIGEAAMRGNGADMGVSGGGHEVSLGGAWSKG